MQGNNTAQVQAAWLKAYHAAGQKVMVSAFGSTDMPTSQDPVSVATALAAFVKKNQLDGADLDYEDNNAMVHSKYRYGFSHTAALNPVHCVCRVTTRTLARARLGSLHAQPSCASCCQLLLATSSPMLLKPPTLWVPPGESTHTHCVCATFGALAHHILASVMLLSGIQRVAI